MSNRRRARRIGCLVPLVALAGPRVALVVVWLAGAVVQTAFQTVLYPMVGVLFLPLTAIAYALAADRSGSVTGAAFAWPVIGFVCDAGLLGLGVYWAVEYRLE